MQLTERLKAILCSEQAPGLDPLRRVAMVMRFGGKGFEGQWDENVR